MVGIGEASVWGDGGPDMAKIGVKLVVALVIAVLAFVAKRQGPRPPTVPWRRASSTPSAA